MSSDITYVTALAPNGLPAAPAEAVRLYKRAARFQVRDNVPIIIKDWRLVPEDTRNTLWANLSEKIRFPKGTEEVAKKASLQKTEGYGSLVL